MAIELTFGAGGFKSTFGDALLYMFQNGYTFIDDINWTQVSDTTETDNVLVNVPMNGFTVTFLNPDGYTINTESFNFALGNSFDNAGRVNYNGLKFYKNTEDTSAILLINGVQSSDNFKTYLYGCIFEGDPNNPHGIGGDGIGIDIQSDKTIGYIWNCKFYNLRLGIYLDVNGGNTGDVDNEDKLFENCAAYNCDYGFHINGTTITFKSRYTFKNCWSFDSAEADWFVGGVTNPYGSFINCADSDNTIAGLPANTKSKNLGGLTASDEIISFDDTSPDFLRPKATSQLYNAGTAPSIAENTTDIEGNPRPNSTDNFSIGVYEPQEEQMSEKFLEVRRTIGFKTEATPYTKETLAAANFGIGAYNISYDTDLQMYARRIARNEISRDTSICGKRGVTITFTIDMNWSGTAATAPKWGDVMESCGVLETVHGATGVSYTPNSQYTRVPATIEVVETEEGTSFNQLVIQARGCMGKARLVLSTIGEPVKMEFEFTGVLQDIIDRAYSDRLDPTGFDTELPEPVLGATVTLATQTQVIDSLTFDTGADVQLFTDPSKSEGYEGAHIVDWAPTLEIDPDLELIANRNLYASLTGNTTMAFLAEIGDHLTFSAPAAQLTQSYKPGSREGHVTNQLTLELKRSSGNDEWKILQGSES